LATAILAAAAERKLELASATDFDSPAGKGVTGTVEGKKVALGNARFFSELNIDTSSTREEAERLRGDGPTAIFLAVDGKSAGVIAIGDPIKQTTPDALKALAADRVRVVMLTGDNRTTAQAVARQLGIGEVEAEVLPDQKGAVVEKLRREGRAVAMAGDGRNDAPALATAGRDNALGTGLKCAVEKRRLHLPERRPLGHCESARAFASRDAQHPAEPVFRIHLQCAWRAGGRRHSLSHLRSAAVANHRRRGYGAVFGQRHRQRFAAAWDQALGANRPRDISATTERR